MEKTVFQIQIKKRVCAEVGNYILSHPRVSVPRHWHFHWLSKGFHLEREGAFSCQVSFHVLIFHESYGIYTLLKNLEIYLSGMSKAQRQDLSRINEWHEHDGSCPWSIFTKRMSFIVWFTGFRARPNEVTLFSVVICIRIDSFGGGCKVLEGEFYLQRNKA